LEIIRDLASVGPHLRGGVVTIGNFDGVHLGHARLLRRCQERAAGRPVVAMTFEPHPVVLLAPQRAPKRLAPPREKLALLAACGATATVVLETDRTLLGTSAEDFVTTFLVQPLRPVCVVEGPTFGFGAGRRGTVDTLRGLGRRLGFEVEVVAPEEVDLDGGRGRRPVSSSLVRELLASGDVERVARCLGRPYGLTGVVVAGSGVGRTLGFPTINLDAGEQQLPADAVYAGRAARRGPGEPASSAAAISIGTRPTFGGTARVVEAFLLDDEGRPEGADVRLDFLARLRDQRKFDSPTALAQQIGRDVETVRRIVREAST
jgi:riboflavin kinase/FMN adenylyltransferase